MRHLSDAFLDDLADSVSRALADNGDGVLFHVSCSDAGVDVGFLPLEGRAPADLLVGTVAPPHWAVLGTAVPGRAWSLDRPGEAATRVEAVVLVARDGRIVSRVRQGDRVLTEPPGSGVTLDCLQRALGLPTAPPEVSPTHLLASMWLEQVVRGGGVGDLQPVDWDWAELRRTAVRAGWPERGVTAEDAAWFDDGAFARWVLSSVPPVPVLFAQAKSVLRPSDARRCLGVLRRLGVDTAA